MAFKFGCHSYGPAEVQDPVPIVKAGLDLREQVLKSWRPLRLYVKDGHKVQTYGAKMNGTKWYARVSKHSEPDYDQFKRGLFYDHTQHEKEYIDMIESFRELPAPEDVIQHGWHNMLVRYKMPGVLSAREMTVWILAVEPTPGLKQFVVISLPSDDWSRSEVKCDAVHGAYCSVEVVTYLESEGCTEWFMATCSDARGALPLWVQDLAMPATITEDVPKFISWAAKGQQLNSD